MRANTVHEAGIFVSGRDVGLKTRNPSLYDAYTQGSTPPATVYIGDDISRLLGNPDVQSQITTKLQSSPELIQIRVTPKAELQVAKRGSEDFHSIDFGGKTPPELRAIVSKTQAVYHQMHAGRTARTQEEEVPLRPHSWSAGYPDSSGHSVPSEHVAHLQQRIHSLEHELAVERMRNEMQGMRSEIREIRSMLESVLEAKAQGEAVSQGEIKRLRSQLEEATTQVSSLTEQAQMRGLENAELRKDNAALQKDLGALCKALAADTTPEALRNLGHLERTAGTLREQQTQLQDVLEAGLPEQLIPKALALREDHAELEARVLELQKRAASTEEELARRLTPQAEHELREQLRAKSEEVAKLKEIRAAKLQADREVERLTAALSERGKLSPQEIKALRKQLTEAQGATRHAEQNARESEERFQAADSRAKQLQNELVLVRKLNTQLQTETDSAEKLRAVLREIAEAVGASEDPSTLPQAVREKVQELAAARELLSAVFKALAGSDSLAVQLHEVAPQEQPLDLSTLPQMVQDRIEEVQRLQETLKRIKEQKSDQNSQVFKLSSALDEANSQLKGFESIEADLAQAKNSLAALEKDAAATEKRLTAEVRDLKQEVRRQEKLAERRQEVVKEVCAELAEVEKQRDRAIQQKMLPYASMLKRINALKRFMKISTLLKLSSKKQNAHSQKTHATSKKCKQKCMSKLKS